MEKVSAVVLCNTREKEIERCLKSLRWADELIVVDSFSTDKTVDLARKHADRVFQREYKSESDQRNWAIRQAKNLWIVMIDSDEVMPEPLRDEIRETLKNPHYGAYKVFRQGIFLGREMKHGGWNRDTNHLLFRKDRYRFNDYEIHVRLIPEDKFGRFNNRLIHYTHRSIDEFVKKSNWYATLGARKYFLQGRRGTTAKMFFHALFNFFKVYVFRRGFLDGARGLISATLSSCYVAEKYAKLWELEQEKAKGKPPPNDSGDAA